MPFLDKQKKAEANKRWKLANPEKYAASRKKSYEKAAEKRKRERAAAGNMKLGRDLVKKSLANAARRQALRLQAIAALGGRCCRCGIADERVLEFDHINPLLRRSSGHKSKSQDLEIARIARGELVDGVQLLCANCHRIKTREGGEFTARASRSESLTNAIDMLQRSLFDMGNE